MNASQREGFQFIVIIRPEDMNSWERLLNKCGVSEDSLILNTSVDYTELKPISIECEKPILAESIIHEICYGASTGKNKELFVSCLLEQLSEIQFSELVKTMQWFAEYQHVLIGSQSSPFRDVFPWGYIISKGVYLYLFIYQKDLSMLSIGGLNVEFKKIHLHSDSESESLAFQRVSIVGKNFDIIYLPNMETSGLMDLYVVELAEEPDRCNESIQQCNDCVYLHSPEFLNSYTWEVFIHSRGQFIVKLALTGHMDISEDNVYKLEFKLFLNEDIYLISKAVSGNKNKTPDNLYLKLDVCIIKIPTEGLHTITFELAGENYLSKQLNLELIPLD